MCEVTTEASSIWEEGRLFVEMNKPYLVSSHLSVRMKRRWEMMLYVAAGSFNTGSRKLPVKMIWNVWNSCLIYQPERMAHVWRYILYSRYSSLTCSVYKCLLKSRESLPVKTIKLNEPHHFPKCTVIYYRFVYKNPQSFKV